MKTEFPIWALNDLLGDIYGLQNKESGLIVKKGLKDQALSIPTKQHLKRLGSKITDERNLYNETVAEFKNLPEDEALKSLLELHKTKVSISHFDFTTVAHEFNNLVCQEDYSLVDYLLPLSDEQTDKVD